MSTNKITFDDFMKHKDVCIRITTAKEYDFLSDAICLVGGAKHPNFYHDADGWLSELLKTHHSLLVENNGFIRVETPRTVGTFYNLADVSLIPFEMNVLSSDKPIVPHGFYISHTLDRADPDVKKMLNSIFGKDSIYAVNDAVATAKLKELIKAPDKTVYKGIRSITVNPAKKVVTVVFKDGDVRMSKCSDTDTFDARIGVAMCLAYHILGSKTQFNKMLDKMATTVKADPTPAPVVKAKRKYVRHAKTTAAPIKPKRKYTRHVKVAK